MFGIPPWAWLLVGIAVTFAVFVCRLYARFRAMCRTVRDEFTNVIKSTNPQAELRFEPNGNLMVRAGNSPVRLIDMAMVYSAVARLPGMGRDPAVRARVYQQVLDAHGPLVLRIHGDRIKPILIPAHALNPEVPGPQTPIPELGLHAIYVLDQQGAVRFLLEQDRNELGINVADLHSLALDNLRRDFPEQLVMDVLAGSSATAIQSQDFFNAVRLLLVPEFLKPGQELVALIPHRDILVLLPGSLARDESKLRESLSAFEHGNHPPLLDRPVLVKHSGFEII